MIETTRTTRHPLIPSGAQMADVEHIEFDVRTMFDYDPSFMRDRLLVTVHTGDRRAPQSYATVAGFEWDEAEAVRRNDGPRLRRMVIDNALGLGYEDDLTEEARKVRLLAEEVALLRRPWWRKAYDKVGSWISGVR